MELLVQASSPAVLSLQRSHQGGMDYGHSSSHYTNNKSEQTVSTTGSTNIEGNHGHHHDNLGIIIDGAALKQQADHHDPQQPHPHQQGQLFFARLGLIGREKEIRMLHNATNRVLLNKNAPTTRPSAILATAENNPSSSSTMRALTLISGLSGSGKSSLAEHPKEDCLARHAFFVQGKFDLHQMDEPFSGIKSAMEQLCQQIKELPRNDVIGAGGNDPRRLSTLRRLLSQSLNEAELQVLSKVIPSLSGTMMLGDNDASDSAASKPSAASVGSMSLSLSNNKFSSMVIAGDHHDEHIGYREISDRQKFALRHFIQIICKYCPLILVVDDIQWADKASLDLMESWLMDSTISSLMIIGSYRSDLFDTNKNLQRTIKTIKECKRERSISVLQLPIDNLGIDSVKEMLVELLSPDDDDDDDVNGLTGIVHKKTGGNVYFVQEYLQSLVQDYLLVFDGDAMKWTWDESIINAKTSATTNIIQLMTSKLERLEAAHQVLPIAACLGGTFSRSTLVMVIRALSIHSGHSAFYKDTFNVHRHLAVSESMIHESLRKCEEEGLIEAHRVDGARQPKQRGKAAGRVSSTSSTSIDTSTSLLTGSGNGGGGSGGDNGRIIHRATKTRSNPKKCDVHSFIHDKVQEAALALVPNDKLSELQYRVGEVLLSGLPKDELDKKIFAVASLINSRLDLVPAGEKQNNRRMKIAMLNYKAGQKAVECSAFHSALRYFETAISLLPHDHWKSQFESSLKIYSSAAECASITYHVDKMKEYCSSIIALDCPILKKAKAYEVLICSSFADMERGGSNTSTNRNTNKYGKNDHDHHDGDGDGDHDNHDNDDRPDTVSLCVSLLKKLGADFPKGKFRRTMATIGGMIFMKRNSSRHALQKIKNLPVSQKEGDATIMKTFGRLSDASFMANPDLIPLVTAKRVQLTMRKGLTPHSPPAFAFQALIVGYFMGDFQAGRKIAELAMGMFDSLNSRIAMCETYANVYSTVWHWTNPIEEVRDSYLEAYEIGLAVGDIDSAMWCMLHHLVNGMLTGVPLAELDDKMSTNLKLMLDCRQTNQSDFLQVYLQAVRNLRGQSDHLTLLAGDVFDERESMVRITKDANREVNVASNRLTAAVYFGEFETGADTTVKLFDKILGTLPGLASLYGAAFEGGLCCFVMSSKASATSAKRKEYLRMGEKCRKKLKEWIKKGNPNCVHTLAILNAERDRSQGKYDSAIKYFGEGIQSAQDRGFIHHEALANERLSVCLLERGCDGQGREALKQATRLYDEWGAVRKVELLKPAAQEPSWGCGHDAMRA